MNSYPVQINLARGPTLSRPQMPFGYNLTLEKKIIIPVLFFLFFFSNKNLISQNKACRFKYHQSLFSILCLRNLTEKLAWRSDPLKPSHRLTNGHRPLKTIESNGNVTPKPLKTIDVNCQWSEHSMEMVPSKTIEIVKGLFKTIEFSNNLLTIINWLLKK